MSLLRHSRLGFSENTQRREESKRLVSSLYEDWYSRLVGYAVRFLASFEDAEDVVQETLTNLYEALLEGQDIGNPKGWTLCAVRRRIIDRRRSAARHGGVFLPLVEDELGGDGARLSAQTETNGDLATLFSVLTPREQEVLLLRVEALKYREIAAELKISTNSVKTLLARALHKMREASKPQAAGPECVSGRAVRATETLQ